MVDPDRDRVEIVESDPKTGRATVIAFHESPERRARRRATQGSRSRQARFADVAVEIFEPYEVTDWGVGRVYKKRHPEGP